MRWLQEKPSCIVCKDIWKDKGSDPPCADCIVVLRHDNEDAIRVYLMCRSQVITAGMEGKPIAPNILTIIEVMKLYNVDNPKDCLWRVLHLFSHFLAEQFESKATFPTNDLRSIRGK